MLDVEGNPSNETQENEGETEGIAYTNEKEKHLYLFLSDSNLCPLYPKLKSLHLYTAELLVTDLQNESFENLCSQSLQIHEPHMKLRFKTAIQSLQSEHSQSIAVASVDLRGMESHKNSTPTSSAQDLSQNKNENSEKLKQNADLRGLKQHRHTQRREESHKILDYDIDGAFENNAVIITAESNSAYRIMIFLRCLLWAMDHFVIQPRIPNKSLIIGGKFGSFLLFLMGILGMYNICHTSRKAGSLSVILACSELFYFISRDALCNVCYQTLFDSAHMSNQFYNLSVHAMLSVVLSCCLGRIIWQYRSQIWAQIHSSKLNIVCNYLMFGWVISWELTTLNEIAFTQDYHPKVDKIYNLLNVFFCTENFFLLGVILLAPPIKKPKNN